MYGRKRSSFGFNGSSVNGEFSLSKIKYLLDGPLCSRIYYSPYASCDGISSRLRRKKVRF